MKKFEGTVECVGYEGPVDLRFKSKTLRKTREKILLPVFKRGVVVEQ